MATDNTEAQLDEQKKALLQAIAEQGSAGRQAFQNAQTANEQQKATAMQQALARATAINAPDAFNQGAAQDLARPFDATASNLSNQQATFDADLARSAATNSSYFDKVKASVPIVRAQSDAEIARILAEAKQNTSDRQEQLNESLLSRMDNEAQRKYLTDQRAADTTKSAKDAAREDELWKRKLEELGITSKDDAAERAFKKEIEQMQLEEARVGLANTRASGARAASSASRGGNYAGAGTPIADLLHGLGGQTAAKATLRNPVADAVSNLLRQSKATTSAANRKAKAAAKAAPMDVFGSKPSALLTKPISKKQALAAVETSLGLPEGALDTILGKDSPAYRKPKSAKELSTAQTNAMRRTKTYSEKAKIALDSFSGRKRGEGISDAKRRVINEIRTADDYVSYQDAYEQVIKDVLAK